MKSSIKKPIQLACLCVCVYVYRHIILEIFIVKVSSSELSFANKSSIFRQVIENLICFYHSALITKRLHKILNTLKLRIIQSMHIFIHSINSYVVL